MRHPSVLTVVVLVLAVAGRAEATTHTEAWGVHLPSAFDHMQGKVLSGPAWETPVPRGIFSPVPGPAWTSVNNNTLFVADGPDTYNLSFTLAWVDASRVDFVLQFYQERSLLFEGTYYYNEDGSSDGGPSQSGWQYQDRNTVVPEPLTMLGMSLGLGSVGAYIRKRRRA